METCYMCESEATTREHVPPKCVFPRAAEHGKDLITVPSCDVHNSNKSKCDEYLRHVVTCAPAVNSLALQVADESLIPSLERRPHMMKTFLPNARPVMLGSVESAAFTVDVERFERAVGSVARGLYFHETQRKLFVKTEMIWGALLMPDLSKAPFLNLVRNMERSRPAAYLGANPKVFQYALHSFNEGAQGICRLRFYEGHPIYIIWGAPESP